LQIKHISKVQWRRSKDGAGSLSDEVSVRSGGIEKKRDVQAGRLFDGAKKSAM